MKKRTWEAYSILNHEGGLWTPQVFKTQKEAEFYLSTQNVNKFGGGLDKHTVVPVKVTMKTI